MKYKEAMQQDQQQEMERLDAEYHQQELEHQALFDKLKERNLFEHQAILDAIQYGNKLTSSKIKP